MKMRQKILKEYFVFLLFHAFIFVSRAPAVDYYVDQNHPIASDQNKGTIQEPWKTITKANQELTAGDTVHIIAGTYTSSYISPINSGTSTNPITYKNYASDTVIISDVSYGMYLNGKSYIVVEGINFYNLDKFLWLQNRANHNTIANCNFDLGRNIGWSGSKIYKNSSYNRVHHCRFSKYGYYGGGDDVGSILDIGNEESRTDFSNYNLIENNAMFHAGHHILGVYGKYNVIRYNYLHNEPWQNGYGNRNLYLAGYPENSGCNLIEGNQIAYSSIPPDNWGASGMALTTGFNIVRRNSFYYNDLAGISMTLTNTYYSDIIHNKINNNTFLHNGWNMATGPDAMTSAIGFAIYSGTHVIKDNTLKNNLFLDHYQSYGSYRVALNEQEFSGNWDGDRQGDPGFINAGNKLGNPEDPTYPDLRLSDESPCIDAGRPLTTIASADGIGTTFNVADSRYFMDRWGIAGVLGDEIQLHGSSQKVRIVSIEYSSNTITVDRDISWKKNQGVSLSFDGLGPDIGAYEFGQTHPPMPPENLRVIN